MHKASISEALGRCDYYQPCPLIPATPADLRAAASDRANGWLWGLLPLLLLAAFVR